MSVKLIIVALLATAATTAAPPQKALTVKTCASATCECTAPGEVKQYVEGNCVKEEPGNKYSRLDTCTADQDATLTSFANEKDCKNPETETASKDCTPVSYIQAKCDTTAGNKVKLMINCNANCDSGCTDVAFEPAAGNHEDCKQYGSLGLYFKPSSVACQEADATFTFNLFTDAECSTAATLQSIDLTKETCTPFMHKKATCDVASSAAKIQNNCYGATGQECTTCLEETSFTWKAYTAYNSKSYLIDTCQADSDLTFKVFSAAPETKTIPHECKASGTGSDYTMGTCGDEGASPAGPGPADPAPAAPKELQVVTDCTENTCKGAGCVTKKYTSGKCVAEDGNTGKFLKADCTQSAPALKKYDTEEKCNQDQDGTAETLPSTTCTADAGKYKQATCVAADDSGSNGPGNIPPTAPGLVVLKECSTNACEPSTCTSETYSLTECTEKNGKAYKATCAKSGASLMEFADKATCQDGTTQGTPVTLPTKDCASDGNSKFQKVVCPPGGPDNMPPGGGMPNGPIILVNASCTDDQCATCSQTLVFNANGSCVQQQTGSYKADCDTLKVTTYTDSKCAEGEQITQYKKTCDEKRIAVCKTNAGSGSPVDGTEAPQTTTIADGSPEAPQTTTTNNSSDGISTGCPPVHTIGALALSLLVAALLY